MDKLKISGTTNHSCTVKVIDGDILIATKDVSQGNYSMVFPCASGTQVDVLAIDASNETDSNGGVSPIVSTDDVDSDHPREINICSYKNKDVWALHPDASNGTVSVSDMGDKITISVNDSIAGYCGAYHPLLISGDFDLRVHYHRDGNHNTVDWGTSVYLHASDGTDSYIRARQTGSRFVTELKLDGVMVDNTDNTGYTIDYDFDYRISRSGDVVTFYNPLNINSSVHSHQWSTRSVYVEHRVEHWNTNPAHSVEVTKQYIF